MVADAASEPIVESDDDWTLEQQGPILPIGVESGGTSARTIEVKPWRLKEERALGELRDKNKRATAFQFAAMVLATMCTKLGDSEFSDPKMKMAAKKLVVSQMFLGDVLYAYLWLRRSALGPKLDLTLSCPNCGKKYIFNADIDSIPVEKVDSLEDALWEYKLQHPFEVRGETAETLTLGPTRWGVFLKMTGVGALKAETIIGSVYKVNDKANPLAQHELDEMSKIDLESIIQEIDDHHVGPDMSLDMVCPHCSHEYKTAIDWSTDDFFGVSGTE